MSEARKRFPIVKTIIGVALLVAFIVAVRLLPLGEWIASFQAWVKDLGAIGYVVYVLAYVVFCIFFLPASVLTIGAGAVFGFVKGTIVVIIGATIGATVSFLLGRTIMRHRIEKMAAANHKFRALDRAIAKEGGKIVFLIRLAPVFPFAFINFAFGLTGVRLLPYIVATFFGIIPVTLAFVYIADTATRTVTTDMDTTKMVIRIVGIAFAIIATAFVTRVALQAVKKAGIEDEVDESDSNMLPPPNSEATP